MFLYICWPKSAVLYQTVFQPLEPSNGKLRNASCMEKVGYMIMNYSNISLIKNKILCVLVFCNFVLFFMYRIFTLMSFFFAHPILFSMKVHSILFLLCFDFWYQNN